MRSPVLNGDIATCTDTATSTSNVLINNRSVCTVITSAAVGAILGPGSPKVRVNNAVISVNGDSVAPHGDTVHGTATMVATSVKVFVP